MKDDARITARSLVDEGLGWVLEHGLLAHLSGAALDAALAMMRWTSVAAGTHLITTGKTPEGVDLVVEGELTVHLDGGTVAMVRLGPGHLVGERSITRGETAVADVVAVSDVTMLRIDRHAFRALLDRSDHVRCFVEDLIELRERQDDLLELLLEHPLLRSLGRADLVRIIQAGSLARLDAGQQLVRAGEHGADAFVVIKGRLGVFAPGDAEGRREFLASKGPGWFFGHAAMLLNTPRTADVEAETDAEVLVVPAGTFRDCLARTPTLQRRLLAQLATVTLHTVETTHGTGTTVGVCGVEDDDDAETVAYGLAAAMVDTRPVVLIDLAGPVSARRLGRTPTTGEVGGIGVHRFEIGGLEVMWTDEPQRALALGQAVLERGLEDQVVIVATPTADRRNAAVLQAVDALVVVREAGDEFRRIPARHGQKRVHAVRVTERTTTAIPPHQGTVRILADLRTPRAFWRGRDLSALVDADRPAGRAHRRLVRVLDGRSVGLALGGGGALGFAHIGLIRALEESGVPIDYVAGASFGSLVGGLYAVGGLPLLEDLTRHGRRLLALAGVSMFSLGPFERFVRSFVGSRHLGSTEIPFLPVCLDVTSGREVVLVSDSVAAGVRSSSAMPGIFPSVNRHPARLVDGGMINNVPASVCWDAGAGFIIGSNVIPPLRAHQRRRSTALGSELYGRSVGRVDDLLHALYMMMARIGRDRATLADYLFNLEVEDWTLYDFHRAPEITEIGTAQARREASRIVEAYRRDRLVHPT